MVQPAPDASVDLRAARAGDRRAFERLVEPHMRRLRALTFRMLGHPEDAADVLQETLLRAFRQLDAFRGDAAFSTWLLHIAANGCLDVLRSRGRWRLDAQPMAKEDCVEGRSSLHRDLGAVEADASFAFDVHEHIAFCFTCVARTLDAEVSNAIDGAPGPMAKPEIAEVVLVALAFFALKRGSAPAGARRASGRGR